MPKRKRQLRHLNNAREAKRVHRVALTASNTGIDGLTDDHIDTDQADLSGLEIHENQCNNINDFDGALLEAQAADEPENEFVLSVSDSDQEVLLSGDVGNDIDLVYNPPSILMWKDGAGSSLRSTYCGNSRTTQWRRAVSNKQRINSMKDNKKMYDFFRPERVGDATPKASTETIVNDQRPLALLSIEEAIERLNQAINVTPNVIIERRDSRTSKWNLIRLLSVRKYFTCLLNGQPKQQSSEEIASVLFSGRNISYFGKQIRKWSQHYIQRASLPDHFQGKFVKTKSLIHDEDVQIILRSFLRSEPQVSLTSSRLAFWVNENLHLKLGLEVSLKISPRTAQRWLNIIGLRFGRFLKGLYDDGHERGDVVRYRNSFLERMLQYEKHMHVYSGDFMEKAALPDLQEGSKPLIIVTHDESCFSAHDGRNYCWLDDDNKPIRPKGSGRTIMVSALLCECHGILRLPTELQQRFPDVAPDSTVIIKPGVNNEGYWRNADLVAQIKDKAIPIFKILHPDSDGLFIFDNSQNHHAKAPDALSVSKMNMSDGGVSQRLMRNGWFENGEGNKIEHKMTLDDGKTSKGLQRVLSERGLWNPLLTVKKARELLAKQPDFCGQREWLEETITEAGCLVDYYPKYHCEFNFIEMFWGASKAWYRAHCTFNFRDMSELVPKALDSVSLVKIRKFARKTYRYMDAYRVRDSNGNSLNTRQIEYAVKKFRGHRKIPVRILESL